MKNKIYKIRLKLLRFTNSIRCIFTKGKKVNIISSLKYKNKVKEDLCLQKQFLKNKCHCKIVAWEDNQFTDINVIRSVWGYHNNAEKFLNIIDNHNTINPKDILVDNINKKKQFEILHKNNIKTIDTKFVKYNKEIEFTNKKLVVKPVVSASGNNTYIIEKSEDISKLNNINDLMVQPYIEKISDGELSIIVIDKEILYGIRRFPGVFTKYKKEEYIPLDKLSSQVIDIVNKIKNIKEYSNATIIRADFVYNNNQYEVMEVEMTDPDLFIEAITDIDYKNEVYQKIVDAVIKK